MASKYTCRILIGPVVEDPTKEVYICPFDRLLGEEVVSHELQPTRKLRRNRAASYGTWKILYDAYEVGKSFRQRDTSWPVRTADVNDCAGTKLTPRIAIQEMRDVVSFRGGTVAHCPCKTLGAPRELGQFIKNYIFGPIRQVETLEKVGDYWRCAASVGLHTECVGS